MQIDQISSNSNHPNVFTGSNLREEGEENINISFDPSQIKKNLKTLFSFYASFGDRTNFHNLKSSKFHKMMRDANITDNHLTAKKLDLLFCKESKNRSQIEFDIFLELLIKLAQVKFEYMERNEALMHLIAEYLNPLYENIMRQTDLGEEEKRFKEEITPGMVNVIRSVSPVLFKIYMAYFPWEPKCYQTHDQIQKRSESSLFSFLKDFDLCPALLTKSSAYTLYNQILETPFCELANSKIIKNIIFFLKEDVGSVWKLSCFFSMILRISLLISEAWVGEGGNEERVKILLERMELSEGFSQLQKKICSANTAKLTLIIKENPSDRFKAESNEQEYEESNTNIKYMNNSNITGKENRGLNSTENSVIFRGERGKFIENKREIQEKMKPIFQYYCSLGEPLNSNRMKSIKFLRFLREFKLLAYLGLSPTEVDLMLAKLMNNGKLDLNLFCKALEILWLRFSNGNEENALSFEDFIEKIVSLKNINISKKLNKCNENLVEIVQDDEIIGLLNAIQKNLKQIFDCYSDQRGLMNFEKYMLFCKDFSIFPDILNKPKLNQIFEALLSIANEDNPENNSIDQHLFIESLAMCALEVPYQEYVPKNIDKVFYFLERLNQSDGIEISQKYKGFSFRVQGKKLDILAKVRDQFQYEEKGENSTNQESNKFEDILKEYTNNY